jgi:hypothetical protein
VCGVGGGGGVVGQRWSGSVVEAARLRKCIRLLLGLGGMRRWTGISGYVQIHRGPPSRPHRCPRLLSRLFTAFVHSYPTLSTARKRIVMLQRELS